MYRLNISFVVEAPVQERWLELMRARFIPYIKEAGYADTIFSRVISLEAADHFTYSLLVPFEAMSDYERLTGAIFAEYTAIAEPLFGAQVVWFFSLLKEL